MLVDILVFLRGTVRPVVTYAFVAGVVVAVFVGKVDAGQLVAMAGPVIGYWFATRQSPQPPKPLE